MDRQVLLHRYAAGTERAVDLAIAAGISQGALACAVRKAGLQRQKRPSSAARATAAKKDAEALCNLFFAATDIDVLSRSKEHAFARPRQAIFQVLRRKGHSLRSITHAFGFRDHRTVIHGLKQDRPGLVAALESGDVEAIRRASATL